VIVTTSKPFETVLGYLRGHRTVFLVGCGTCAQSCRTGGEGEVQELARRLEAAGKRVLGYTVPDEPCHLGLVKRRLREYGQWVKQAEAVVVLACGAGVQAVGQAIDKAVYPALDTHFLGTAERVGVINRTCSTCGDCLLGETAAVCPITGCAKSLRHGPCGGVQEGYCEVYPEQPCAWVSIHSRMESFGQKEAETSRPVFSPARPPARPMRRLTVPRHRLR
jgi:ferredoxin